MLTGSWQQSVSWKHGGVPGSLAGQADLGRFFGFSCHWHYACLSTCPVTVYLFIFGSLYKSESLTQYLLSYSALPSPVQFRCHLFSALFILKQDDLDFVFLLPLQRIISCEWFPVTIPFLMQFLSWLLAQIIILSLASPRYKGNQISLWTVLEKMFLDPRYSKAIILCTHGHLS